MERILSRFIDARERAMMAREFGQGETWARVAERWARVEAILAMALESEEPEKWEKYL